MKFAIIGLDHNHCYNHIKLLTDAGAEFAAYYSDKPELVKQFGEAFPGVPAAASMAAILGDESIAIIGGAAEPAARADISIQAMQHGKDVIADKPSVVNLDQLGEIERVQKETGRIWALYSNEHHDRRSTVRAGELVAEGAIGRVIQTTGLGPHHFGDSKRPDWFMNPATSGGVIGDLGSHQIEQFLAFTGSTEAEITFAQTGNFARPEYPDFQDFGEAALRGNGGVGWFRVDWHTPKSLGVPGDIRLIVLGTDGYLEARKYINPAGEKGYEDANGRWFENLLLVNADGARMVDLSQVRLKFGERFLADVRNRTETAIPQARSFLTARLAAEAQAMARPLSAATPPIRQGVQ